MSSICSGNIQLYVTEIFFNEGYVGLGIRGDLSCHKFSYIALLRILVSVCYVYSLNVSLATSAVIQT